MAPSTSMPSCAAPQSLTYTTPSQPHTGSPALGGQPSGFAVHAGCSERLLPQPLTGQSQYSLVSHTTSPQRSPPVSVSVESVESVVDTVVVESVVDAVVFVVLDRWMTRDWLKLGPMVECRDVHSRVADMVHCRPNAGLWSGVDAACQHFGVANLPAVVVVRPDGSHQTLELPSSSTAIARFLDAAQAEGKIEP